MSNESNTCGEEGFSPIGTSGKPFSGTFDGGAKVISNLTIDKPEQNYVGLFGYIKGISSSNMAKVYGIRIKNEIVKGATKVGGLIGYTNSYSSVKEIELDNINISGNGQVGGLIGSTGISGATNILIKSESVTATGTTSTDYAGLVVGTSNTYFSNTIVENGTLTTNVGSYYTTGGTSYNTYHSENVIINGNKVANGYEKEGINDINFYEAAGLDTWIGGDNDSSGYYFDYEGDSVILKSINKNPITFNLSKDSEGNYLIKNEKDWKEASTRPSETYKIMNNLDFSTNKYYMLGSNVTGNGFSGILNGNDKEINNVSISGSKVNYLGMIGYLSGTVYGLIINNPSISGYDYTGIIGYIKGTSSSSVKVYGIRIKNEIVNGNKYVGGLIGYTSQYDSVKEIELDNINISGNSLVGGLIGYRSTNGLTNVLIKNETITSTGSAGLVNGSSTSWFTNSIVENATLESGGSYYTTSESKNSYHSGNVTINESKVTDGFATSLIGNLNYYSGKIETSIDGDTNNTGYYFDYVSDKGGIYLVKVGS